jgi:hypothetical protein
MPGLVPGIHVFTVCKQGVDGRDKPGHDAGDVAPPAQRGMSMLRVARTSALTSESAEATGRTTR